MAPKQRTYVHLGKAEDMTTPRGRQFVPRTWKVRIFIVLTTFVLSIVGLFGWSEYDNRDRPIPCDATIEEIIRIERENWERESLWENFSSATFGISRESSGAFLKLIECEE